MVDEQFHAAGGLVDVPDDDGGTLDGRDPGRLPRHAVGAAVDGPGLGQHTDEIGLAELRPVPSSAAFWSLE